MLVYESIEFMVAMSLLVFGLSSYLYPHAWISWRDQLVHDRLNASLKIGAAHFVVGVFILSFHWIWSDLELVVTLLGAILMLNGIFHLLVPIWFSERIRLPASSLRVLLRVVGPLSLVLSLLIFYNLFPLAGTGDACDPAQNFLHNSSFYDFAKSLWPK